MSEALDTFVGYEVGELIHDSEEYLRNNPNAVVSGDGGPHRVFVYNRKQILLSQRRLREMGFEDTNEDPLFH